MIAPEQQLSLRANDKSFQTGALHPPIAPSQPSNKRNGQFTCIIHTSAFKTDQASPEKGFHQTANPQPHRDPPNHWDTPQNVTPPRPFPYKNHTPEKNPISPPPNPNVQHLVPITHCQHYTFPLLFHLCNEHSPCMRATWIHAAIRNESSVYTCAVPHIAYRRRFERFCTWVQ